ncbi:hypothetical protein LCGC14_1822040 [marine sediment metagenome]|uniref:Uncharacterized protein n=1 Tax=marine sediment metagenome TaxID=412755 RepID=A0A0F9GIP8_9ZZZZ
MDKEKRVGEILWKANQSVVFDAPPHRSIEEVAHEIDQLYNESPSWQNEGPTKTASRFDGPQPDQYEIERDKISKSNAIGIGLIEPDQSSRLLDIDAYLEEMGWTLSKNGMAYAWLKQFRDRQDAQTAKHIEEHWQKYQLDHAKEQVNVTTIIKDAECEARIASLIQWGIEQCQEHYKGGGVISKRECPECWKSLKANPTSEVEG